MKNTNSDSKTHITPESNHIHLFVPIIKGSPLKMCRCKKVIYDKKGEKK